MAGASLATGLMRKAGEQRVGEAAGYEGEGQHARPSLGQSAGHSAASTLSLNDGAAVKARATMAAVVGAAKARATMVAGWGRSGNRSGEDGRGGGGPAVVKVRARARRDGGVGADGGDNDIMSKAVVGESHSTFRIRS